MRYLYIPLPVHLPYKWPILAKGRLEKLALLTTQENRSLYLKRYASWQTLKPWLANISYQKCWYCEAKSIRAPFDVDHFRPKLEITVNRIQVVTHDGYYWLAYNWDNFRLSCIRCNRPEKDNDVLHGKANEFPLQTEGQRCVNPIGNIENEVPTLLDPCVEKDSLLLAHGLDGEVKPIADPGTWEFERANYTINTLGFNSFGAPEEKRKAWLTLATLIQITGNNPNLDVAQRLIEHISPDHEYSSFFRSVIGTHRNKAWIEAIL